MSKYEYRITSDNPNIEDYSVQVRSLIWLRAVWMCDEAERLLGVDEATWAQVEFVRIDDDGTHEVLRRLRLD